jgi:hypothetical protein
VTIDLSVLICSTHTRFRTFGRGIQEQIWPQYAALSPEAQASVEILMLTDNKMMMLGHKRNIMVDMAQGRYVVFVDDDDVIEPDYLVSLLDAARFDADVITFLVSVTQNGGTPMLCRYSKDFPRDRNTPVRYERLPNHICAVKKEKAAQVSFPNVVYGEDAPYAKLLKPLLETEHHIPRVLYHYRFDAQTTETQTHLKARMRRRSTPPIVDVIMLSRAETPELAEMTQEAINTCISGANSMPVNIIVLEQNPTIIYQHATTVVAPEEFNYNAFANIGAKLGNAPWIMVANNDLIFTDGWLHHLLAAQHPVVSPKCPKDIRQRDIVEPKVGYQLVKNLSGWCFMLKRELWERMGGFDESVTFWCSDDALLEQLRALDAPAMLVPASEVEHIQSVTLKQRDSAVQDDFTWGQLNKFEQEHGPHRLARNASYLRWKQQYGLS